MCRRNVYEYSEHLNHKDRGIKYPEYREDVSSRMISPSKKVAGSDVVTPRSSLLLESVRVNGGVLWSSKKFQTRGELRNSREEQVFDNDCRDAMRAGTSGGRVCVWCAAVRTVHGCGVWE